MKAKWIVGGVIIIALAIFGGQKFVTSQIQYVTNFEEARRIHSKIQLKGRRTPAEEKYDIASNQFHFTLSDDKGDKIPVTYLGVKPGNFDQAESIVAIGRFKNGIFEADQLLVKCPSKYQGETPQTGKANS
jgi:cytochrome c-type biogenesis protein CcmE